MLELADVPSGCRRSWCQNHHLLSIVDELLIYLITLRTVLTENFGNDETVLWGQVDYSFHCSNTLTEGETASLSNRGCVHVGN